MIERPLYIEKIMSYTDTSFVKILTGIRRCGKSTILKMIMEKLHTERGIAKEQIVSYRFDSMEYEDMTAKQMYKELKSKLCQGKRTYYFLDEVQDIEGWERVVNSLSSDFGVPEIYSITKTTHHCCDLNCIAIMDFAFAFTPVSSNISRSTAVVGSSFSCTKPPGSKILSLAFP